MENSQVASDGMPVKKFAGFIAMLLVVSAARSQSILRLKTKQGVATGAVTAPVRQNSRTPGLAHWIVQFPVPPGLSQLTELNRRDVRVLSYVPDNGLSVAARANTLWEGLGAQWIGQLQPQEKISPLLASQLGAGGYSAAIVESYADVEPGDVSAIVNQAGAVLEDSPDLLANHLLVWLDAEQLQAIAGWDEVAYIFPASRELSSGMPVTACAGALTSLGTVAQSVALVDDGWDGPGLGSVDLKYSFAQLTDKVAANAAQSEIERALSEWSQYVMVNFTPSTDISGDSTLSILFASGAHGDGYPFTGGVVAHTFYPVPTNPEPIAGDMHFNADENWKIGANLDVYSVALHEAGHALGLGHSDNPADVMYPYYQLHTTLQGGDISAIQQLYAARAVAAPSNPTPQPWPSNALLLVVQAPPSTTTASSIGMSGALSGGVGTVTLTWSTNQGFSGTAQAASSWTIPSVPLNVGANVITIIARDSTKNVATQTVTVTRQQTSAPPSDPPPPSPSPGTPDTTPPSLSIVSPPSSTFTTSASTIVVSGTASDNVGVTKVAWTASSGASGTATGTTNWSIAAIPLYVGTTTIVVTANDAAGNSSWRSVVVTRN